MTEWLIKIKGDRNDLDLLQRFLRSGKYTVIHENASWFLKVHELTSDTTPREIRDAAISAIEIVNGAARLFYSKFQGVSSNVTVLTIMSDGSRQEFNFLNATAPDYNLTVFRDTDTRLTDWIALANNDQAVANALTLYGALELTWKNLYIVLEAVEDDIVGGESGLINHNWVPKSQIKLFKTTANSFRALGRVARHGPNNKQPPQRPMTIQEARKLINNIVRKWLESKGSKILCNQP